MTKDPVVIQCSRCGTLFRKKAHDICTACIASENEEINCLVRVMTRQRHMSNDELAAEANISLSKIRAWIRSGQFKIYDYPNIFDNCDLCKAPIRSGKLCYACTTRIKDDIEKVYQQERLMRDRLRQANAYISRK